MPQLAKIKNKLKQPYFFLLSLLVGLGLFAYAPQAMADGVTDWIKHYTLVVIAHVVYYFLYAVGLLFINVLHWLAVVAAWNHFIDVPTVIQGWVIVRDLSNMFFILVLLVIAFATILRVENYSARRLLPKLLLMALLINFSRTICGLIIDAAQVVMLTFVAGFSHNGINNLVDLFGLKNMVTMVSDSTNPAVGDVQFMGVLAGIIIAFLAIVIAMIVVIILLAVLLFRVIMLWLYVILSPLAFLLSTFPAGARYASMWWQEFTKQVIIGPILAFFLWLAIATAQSSSTNLASLELSQNFQSGIVTSLFTADNFQVYIITLGLLLGGLITAQQLGGAAGSLAGRGLSASKGQIRKLTGARYVGERWGAFQAKRESARKAKVERVGQRLYGAYSTGVGAAKAGLAGGYAATLGKGVAPFKQGLKRISTGAFRDWRSLRQRASQHLEEAFEKMAQQKEDGEIFAKDGFHYIKKGNKVEVRDNNNQRILTKGAVGMDFARAFKKSFSSAALIKDKIAKERVNEDKGRFANFSLAELRRVLTSLSSSASEKQAAALMLATKKGFQDEGQFWQAKQAVNASPSLAKEFNETANKHYGYWNSMYRDSTGAFKVDEDSLSAKIADGTIEVSKLDLSQIRSKQDIDVIAKIRDIEFPDDLKKMARTSQDREKLKKVLAEDINQREFKGADLGIRKAYAFNLGGDIRQAFADANGQLNHQALQEALRNAKAEHLANISRDSIDKDEQFQRNFVQAINLSQLKSLERSGKSPEKLRKYLQIIAQRAGELGREDLLNQIERDNTLRSILQSARAKNQTGQNQNSQNQNSARGQET